KRGKRARKQTKEQTPMKNENRETRGTGRGVARHDALAGKADNGNGETGNGARSRFNLPDYAKRAKEATPRKPEACALPVAVASRAGITARDAQARTLAVRDSVARNVAHH